MSSLSPPSGNGKLTDKVALITGGAQGLGAEVARRFIAEGAKVLLTDVLVDKGKALADELGPNALFSELDVGNEKHWAQAINLAISTFGHLHILINNAAILLLAPVESTSLKDYERIIRVNQIGPFLGIRAVAPVMKRAGGGSIVNIGSTDGVFPGDQGLIAYAATKWALRGMTKVSAVELGRYGIRVNTVNPDAGNPLIARSAGTISIDHSGKPFFPADLSDEALFELSERMYYRILKRLHSRRKRIDEIVPMILLLASDDGSACTGGDYLVDGGYSAGMVGFADHLGLTKE